MNKEPQPTSGEYKLKSEDKKIIAKEKIPIGDQYLDILKERGLDDYATVYKKVLEIAETIKASGGKVLLVGGSIRDMMMGTIPKDYDIEIYGLEPEEIKKILTPIGKVSEVGEAFGVLKVFFPKEGLDIDVSLPRKDSKTGKGHKDFSVEADPNMSIIEAAKRRDFTMNSICADPLTGEIFDAFGGLEDIKNRKLKITDNELFKDDPLRVLRGMQFIGRFGLEVDKDSVPILQEMAPLVKDLSKERILEEWKKLLLKSEKPSLGLAAAMNLGILREIHPELPPLRETPQEPEWHPEGDVWIHTLMVIDEAAKIARREELDDAKKFTLLLTALCHDLGKPATTETREDGKIISHAHDKAGIEPTKKFLAQLGVDNLTRDKVVKLVGEHLTPTLFYIEETVRGNHIKDGAIRRLAKRLHPATIQELVLVSESDHLGRGEFPNTEVPEQLMLDPMNYPAGKWLLTRARELEVEDSRPADLTQGRHWLAFGFKPGPNLGKLIRLANDLRDDKGFSREMVFEAVDGIADEDKAVAKLEKLLEPIE